MKQREWFEGAIYQDYQLSVLIVLHLLKPALQQSLMLSFLLGTTHIDPPSIYLPLRSCHQWCFGHLSIPGLTVAVFSHDSDTQDWSMFFILDLQIFVNLSKVYENTLSELSVPGFKFHL